MLQLVRQAQEACPTEIFIIFNGLSAVENGPYIGLLIYQDNTNKINN